MIAFLVVGCPYKAKGVVLYAPVFYSSILKGIISSCVVVVLVEVCRVEVYSV